jgi:hypothetical protein
VRVLLPALFTGGLSAPLVDALEAIASALPQLLPQIQRRLIDAIGAALQSGGGGWGGAGGGVHGAEGAVAAGATGGKLAGAPANVAGGLLRTRTRPTLNRLFLLLLLLLLLRLCKHPH